MNNLSIRWGMLKLFIIEPPVNLTPAPSGFLHE